MNELFKDLTWYKRIAVLRAIKGWTQTEAAEKCFVNQKAFWSWESGNVYPQKNSRRAIAKAFGVSEKEIFNQ